MDLELNKQDFIIIIILTFLYLLLSSYNLGARRIPSTSWMPSGPCEVLLELDSTSEISSLHAFMGDGRTVKFDIYCSSQENRSYVTSFEGIGYYQWGKAEIDRASEQLMLIFQGQTGRINEIVLTDEDGKKIDLGTAELHLDGVITSDVGNLFDEQDKVKLPITSFSQAYFDEIYFVRAAKELIEGEEVYEWTHPPLGKLLISLSITLFGFNPFGWRILGAIFSASMIPVVYIFSKGFFQSRMSATISASLLTLDFMHFTMGRIATTEAFAVFFNLVSCFFFYINYRSLREDGVVNKFAIFLGSLSFSLAFSTKWYTFFGLVSQMFLILMLYLNAGKRGNQTNKIRNLLLELMPILLVSFSVSVAVYFSTYIPYVLQGHSLKDVYDLQWRMLGYHSQLEATHPYSSPWWSWPFNLRPLWLTVDYLPGGTVSTVVAMGNPLIWWAGTVSAILIAGQALKGGDHDRIYLTATLLLQWLPFALVSRCLFIYHFYLTVPIMVLMITLYLDESWRIRSRRRLVIVYLIAVAVSFAIFYPVISGHPIPDQYRRFLRWLPSWAF